MDLKHLLTRFITKELISMITTYLPIPFKLVSETGLTLAENQRLCLTPDTIPEGNLYLSSPHKLWERNLNLTITLIANFTVECFVDVHFDATTYTRVIFYNTYPPSPFHLKFNPITNRIRVNRGNQRSYWAKFPLLDCYVSVVITHFFLECGSIQVEIKSF